MRTAVITLHPGGDVFADGAMLRVLDRDAIRLAVGEYAWRRPILGGVGERPDVPTSLRAHLDDCLARASREELPAILAELERAKAAAWAKLLPTTNGTPSDAYVKLREVAARLNISRARVYELVREGSLPTTKFGPRGIRVPRAALERWEQRPRLAR